MTDREITDLHIDNNAHDIIRVYARVGGWNARLGQVSAGEHLKVRLRERHLDQGRLLLVCAAIAEQPWAVDDVPVDERVDVLLRINSPYQFTTVVLRAKPLD